MRKAKQTEFFKEKREEARNGRSARAGKATGTSLLTGIKMILKQRTKYKGRNGKFKTTTRLMRAAEAYVERCEDGEFAHQKELMERQDGKVPNTVANPDGTPLKLYATNLPLTGPNAP